MIPTVMTVFETFLSILLQNLTVVTYLTSHPSSYTVWSSEAIVVHVELNGTTTSIYEIEYIV